MTISHDQVSNEIIDLLQTLSGDWEYSGTITPETGLLSEMGLESLELVVLGVAIQEKYKHPFPFAEFFAELGERQVEDVYVGDLVQFVHKEIEQVAAGGSN